MTLYVDTKTESIIIENVTLFNLYVDGGCLVLAYFIGNEKETHYIMNVENVEGEN